MKRMVTLSLFLMSMAMASLTYAISPSVVGNWNITFYLEPLRAVGATQCIVVKQVPGTVGGITTSGTWSSPTFPGWFGQWVQLGDHVRWFGVTGSLATTESGNMVNRNIFAGVSFNHYNKINSVTSSSGGWYGVRTAACRVGGVPYVRDDIDPSNDPLAMNKSEVVE